MVPILFYGVPSGCSFGSIVALEWLGEPYRLCRVEMPEVVRSEAYRRINPVAETPSLLTSEGRVVSESMAILNHLGVRGIGKSLAFRQGTAGFDRLNQMLAFLNTSLFNGFGPLWHVVEHESSDAEKDALRTYGAINLVKAHADLERMLGKKEWMLGDHPTMADAYFIGIARWADYHDVLDRQDYPNLQRLFEKLERDPAVRFAHGVERGEPVAGSGAFQGEVALEEVVDRIGRAT